MQGRRQAAARELLVFSPASEIYPRGRNGSSINARSACASYVWGRTWRSGNEIEKPVLASGDIPAILSMTRCNGPSNSISRVGPSVPDRLTERISVALSFQGVSMPFPKSVLKERIVRAERKRNNDLRRYGSFGRRRQAATPR